MYIEKLYVSTFRCYKQSFVYFKKGLNIVVGDNAIGKTTLVEAIHTLCLAKSFRAKADAEMIQYNADKFAIKGEFSDGKSKKTVILLYSNNLKRIKVDNEFVKTLGNYVGNLPVVCYSPSNIMFFLSGSLFRRKFINTMLCQLSREYLFVSNEYNKILKERNALLKMMQQDSSVRNKILLDTLTERLIVEGNKIIDMRCSFVNNINNVLDGTYKRMFGSFDELKLVYLPSVEKKEFCEKTKAIYYEEVKKGTTQYGPHKDDYIFIINNKNIGEYGSQGQQKAALLCVKIALSEMFCKEKKVSPIVLLDDVFGELDAAKQNKLLSLFQNVKQVIMTTTTLSDIDKKMLINANVIYLNEKEETQHGRK